jgi:hypothetical protein|tara:strand:- start:6106 stop:6288 length:183 start_codon:yes stop_codon:yes gene_type:complete
MSLNNLLSLNAEKLKEKDLEISLLKKIESEFNESSIDSEQSESELVGDSFSRIEYSDDNI